MIEFIKDIPNYENFFLDFIDQLLEKIYTEVYITNNHHVMIDVGANVGSVTTLMLKHIVPDSGKVIAIDAHPDWLNNYIYSSDNRVQKYNNACYSKPQFKKFIHDENLTGIGFIGLSPFIKGIQDIKKLKTSVMQCYTLDELIDIEDNQMITFIKTDVESADFEVILGGANIIKKHRPFIVFEFTGQYMEKAHKRTREEFFSFFKTNDYSLYSVGLGHTVDMIEKSWDIFMPEFKDLLAIPNEFLFLVK